MTTHSAEDFIDRLQDYQSDDEKLKISRLFTGDAADNAVIGVRMRDTFSLAKAFQAMPLAEVARLLDSPYYEARLGAVSILDFKARGNRLSQDERKALFDLYLSKHDRINDWGLVDRAAPFVVGRYLADKPRDILYELARSDDRWRRRTAITAPLYFVRYGTADDVADIIALAELLIADPEQLVNKSVGIALKYVAALDKPALLRFLDKHAQTMPAATYAYAVEKLEPAEKASYKRLRP